MRLFYTPPFWLQVANQLISLKMFALFLRGTKETAEMFPEEARRLIYVEETVQATLVIPAEPGVI